MGQHADDAINEALDLEVRHSMYAAGQISHHDAYEEGLVDELGCTPPEVMHLYNQVDDQFSLETKLQIASLQLENALNKRLSNPKTVSVWASNGKIYLPHQMTTSHLKNSIAYAERNGLEHQIVKDMKQELLLRTS